MNATLGASTSTRAFASLCKPYSRSSTILGDKLHACPFEGGNKRFARFGSPADRIIAVDSF
jgi:hypothetical protein